MHAEEIADLCLEETGAGNVSQEARAVCYAAMLYANQPLKVHRKKIRQTFRDSGEYGSFFLIFVLPVLISLVSNWLVKWLWSSSPTMAQIRTMRSQAYRRLTSWSPALTAKLTSIDSPES